MSAALSEPQSPGLKVWKPERESEHITRYTVQTYDPTFSPTKTNYSVYKYQMDAPTPKPIMRQRNETLDDYAVPFYGQEYHGTMDHKQSARLLHGTADGTYLVRRSPGAEDFYTLSLRFDQRTRHYRIHHDRQLGHYLRATGGADQQPKHFETVYDLAADGLLDFYMRTHAAGIIASIAAQTRQSYQHSPYMTLNRRKLRALSGDLRLSLRFESASKAPESGVTDDSCISAAGLPVSNPPDIQVFDATSSCIEEDVLPVVYEKSHAFKVHTFKGLNWCELCANFLWGFTAQGVKCGGKITLCFSTLPFVSSSLSQIVASSLTRSAPN